MRARAALVPFAVLALWSTGASAAWADTAQQVAALVARAKADMPGDPAHAAREAAQAQTLAAALPTRRARELATVTALWLRAEALSRQGNAAAAAPLIARARATMQRAGADTELQANVLLTSGSVRGDQADVAGALGDFLRAHQLFAAANDQRKQAISLVYIAILYNAARDYPTAIHYLSEALDTYPNDPNLALSIYNNRAVDLKQQGKYAAADADFHKALALARKVRSTISTGQFLRNMARNYLLAGRLPQADEALRAAQAIPQRSRDDARQLDAVAAQAALQHHRPEAAEQLIARAFDGVDLATTDLTLRDAHQTAVAVYQALDRPAPALAHLRALKRLDDRADKLATQASTALMAARFDSANQEAKIERLSDEERLRQAREALQRAQTEETLWLGGAGATATVILLLLIGLVTIRRSRDQVRAVAADLAETNGALGKALAAKTEFLATTSHEIRTPLNGILGMAQVMLADRSLPAPARDRLGVLQSAGLAMRSLVDDILDMAKVETGHLTLEAAPFDLPATLGEAARIWTDQAREKGIALVTDLAGCPPRVVGDAARVRQIACNLLSNALKFTATGSVTLAAVATDGGVRVSVTDTGIGIAPDKLELIFESFRQADTSTTRRFGGTGLGLAICRSLARAMGGEVSVTSRLGEGSTFSALLPLPAAEAPATPVAASGDALLIVDRNPITRAMLRTLFAARIEAVAVAGSIAEATARLAEGGVTRVLLDDATARADGDPDAAVSAVLAGAGSAAVVLLWPGTDAATGERLRALGLSQVIAKPINGPALVAALLDHNVDASLSDMSALVSEAA